MDTHADALDPSRLRTASELALHRRLDAARCWLTVLCIGWVLMLLGTDSGMQAVGWVSTLGCFGWLFMCGLPFGRGARASVSWCTAMTLALPLSPVWGFVASPSIGAIPSVVWVAANVFLVATGIVAFATVMRDLARLAGVPESMRQWRSVRRWQLGVLVVMVGLGVTFDFGTLTAPYAYEVDSPLTFFGWAGVLLGVWVAYPIIAIRTLTRHLAERFDPWAAMERGELVWRDAAEDQCGLTGERSDRRPL